MSRHPATPHRLEADVVDIRVPSHSVMKRQAALLALLMVLTGGGVEGTDVAYVPPTVLRACVTIYPPMVYPSAFQEHTGSMLTVPAADLKHLLSRNSSVSGDELTYVEQSAAASHLHTFSRSLHLFRPHRRGFDIDFVRRLGLKLRVDVVFQYYVDFTETNLALRNGECDLGTGGYTSPRMHFRLTRRIPNSK